MKPYYSAGEPTKLHYTDESVTLWHGDALDALLGMDDASVDCCVTSPPYFGLRDYGVEGQLGLEASPAEYVENLRALFAEVRRVLADDGTFWLNLGDSYSAGNGARAAQPAQTNTTSINGITVRMPRGATPSDCRDTGAGTFSKMPPTKNLLGIPWRVAFALQDDGWILRNDIIWAKPNGMPESVTDRLSTKHEHLFLFSKRARYWFDLDPIREPVAYPQIIQAERPEPISDDPTAYAPGMTAQSGRARTGKRRTYGKGHGFDAIRPQTGRYTDPTHSQTGEGGRNPGDVWSVNTQPFSAAHFAVMPTALAERAIQAGCKPGGIVLDPFSGSGTTGLAAARHGRKYVGIDLNAEYLDLSLKTRLAQPGLNFGETA